VGSGVGPVEVTEAAEAAAEMKRKAMTGTALIV